MMKNSPYLDIGVDIMDLTPEQFKSTYKGAYSKYFKRVKDYHNKYLGIKKVSGLLKLAKKMNYYGVVYKITQVRDENGNKIHDGPVLVYNGKKIQNGYHRIGLSVDFMKRMKAYYYKAGQANYPFENLLNIYKIAGKISKCFKVELLAVCKTERELKATEIFWQLYYNRENNRYGYDLLSNKEFNLIIGSYDDLKMYNIPKYALVRDLLDGLEPYELRIKWKQKGALELRLKQYFGTTDTYEIKKMLVAPYIEKCFKKGLTQDEALKFLYESGIKIFSEKAKQKRIELYGPTRRLVPYNTFIRILRDLYHGPTRSTKGHKSNSLYNQLRFERYMVPYVNYLREIGIEERLARPYHRDPNTGYFITEFADINDINEFSIIEHLFIKESTWAEIAVLLGMCSWEDSKEVRVTETDIIRSYMKKYIRALEYNFGRKVSWEDVRNYLRSHYLGDNE